MSGVIVLDTPEEFCRNEGASEEDLDEYKLQTLPLLGYFDNQNLLRVVITTLQCFGEGP